MKIGIFVLVQVFYQNAPLARMDISRQPSYGLNVVAMLSNGVGNTLVRDAWNRMMTGYQPKIGQKHGKRGKRRLRHFTKRLRQ